MAIESLSLFSGVQPSKGARTGPLGETGGRRGAQPGDSRNCAGPASPPLRILALGDGGPHTSPNQQASAPIRSPHSGRVRGFALHSSGRSSPANARENGAPIDKLGHRLRIRLRFLASAGRLQFPLRLQFPRLLQFHAVSAFFRLRRSTNRRAACWAEGRPASRLIAISAIDLRAADPSSGSWSTAGRRRLAACNQTRRNPNERIAANCALIAQAVLGRSLHDPTRGQSAGICLQFFFRLVCASFHWLLPRLQWIISQINK